MHRLRSGVRLHYHWQPTWFADRYPIQSPARKRPSRTVLVRENRLSARGRELRRVPEAAVQGIDDDGDRSGTLRFSHSDVGAPAFARLLRQSALAPSSTLQMFQTATIGFRPLALSQE